VSATQDLTIYPIKNTYSLIPNPPFIPGNHPFNPI
jgi:hypothetical protein